MDLSFNLEDPSDWPAELTKLREMDQLLRCPICKEYFATAMVTTNCGHTFCSLCVRRCLTQETKCPSCRCALTESEMHPNRLIDSLVLTFKSGRRQLLDALQTTQSIECRTESKNSNDTSKMDAFMAKAESRKRQRMQTRSMAKVGAGLEPAQTPTPQSCSEQKSALSVDMTAASAADVASSDIECLSTSDIEHGGAGCEGSVDSSSPVERKSADVDDDSDFMPESAHSSRSTGKGNTGQRTHTLADRVKCPSCGEEVRQARINWHLDRCLAGLPTPASADHKISATKRIAPPSSSVATAMGLRSVSSKLILPRPTKLAYSLLSEPKLRRTLKELGIPSNGDKHQMQARHAEWVNIYMANADSESPVAHSVLLRRLKAWCENMEKPADANTSSSGGNGSKPTPTDQQDVMDHTARYADSFASLVAQANATRTKRCRQTSSGDETVAVLETPPPESPKHQESR